MTEDSLPQPPPTDAWVAAVHASEDDFEPLGSAVVIAADQVLTCAHVVMAEGVVRVQIPSLPHRRSRSVHRLNPV